VNGVATSADLIALEEGSREVGYSWATASLDSHTKPFVPRALLGTKDHNHTIDGKHGSWTCRCCEWLNAVLPLRKDQWQPSHRVTFDHVIHI